MDTDSDQSASRPAGGLPKSVGTEADKEDDEDDSGDDTFGDEDNGLGPEWRGRSRLDSDEDSADTTQSSEDSTSQENNAQDAPSDSRDHSSWELGSSAPFHL